MITIAKTVYSTEEIKLSDDTVVTLAPLPIAPLKRFMKAWGEVVNLKEEEDALDIYITCSGIALEPQLRDKAHKTLTPEKDITPEFREYLEEVLDVDTIFKVLDICGGIKLNDPKALAMQTSEEVEVTV